MWQLLAQVAPNRGLPTAAKQPAESVCIAPWPHADTSRPGCRDRSSSSPISRRCSARCAKSASAQNIPLKEELSFTVRCDAATAEAARTDAAVLHADGPRDGHRLGPDAAAPDVAASVTLAGQAGPIEVHVDVSRFIDVGAERKRLEKERDNIAKQIACDRRQARPTRASSTKPRPKCRAARNWRDAAKLG